MPIYLIKISASMRHGTGVLRPFEAPDFRAAKTVALRRLDYARSQFTKGWQYDTWEIFKRHPVTGKHIPIASGKAEQP